MKRKFSTTKNSQNLVNKIFNSNKILSLETNMDIKASKIFKVGDKEFTSIEEANQFVAQGTVTSYLACGVDYIIDNSEDFIKNLKVLKGIKYSNVGVGKGNLKDINEHLEGKGSSLVRSTIDWPVYTVNTPSESFVIRFTGKVWELHGMIVDNPDWISEVKKYKV